MVASTPELFTVMSTHLASTHLGCAVMCTSTTGCTAFSFTETGTQECELLAIGGATSREGAVQVVSSTLSCDN